MSEEDKDQRRQNARMRMRERAAQSNEKTMLQLLDESRLRRSAIIAEAAKRTRDNRDAPQRFLGEPPPVETLFIYACKRDKDAIIAQMETNSRVEAAIKKLSSLSAVLGVPIRDLPMSAKERFARNEVLEKNRVERKKALLGVEKIAGQFIEDAKRNRTSIYESAIRRAEHIKQAATSNPAPSDTVDAVFDWIQKRAKSAITAAVNQRAQPHCGSTQLEASSASSCPTSTGHVAKRLDANVEKIVASLGACDRTTSTSGSQVHESSSVILSHDVFRFGRKRDFDLLESTCREVVSLQLAIYHLESIREQGLFGVSPLMLSKESRIKTKISSIPQDIAVSAAITLQRLCLFRILQNRHRDSFLKRPNFGF
uniref:HTH cro/C1-type domain-containing protein n=1 Tax=Cryptomonas curvata TaxID=233186 RepID=A0A7S0MWF9_9CRYP